MAHYLPPITPPVIVTFGLTFSLAIFIGLLVVRKFSGRVSKSKVSADLIAGSVFLFCFSTLLLFTSSGITLMTFYVPAVFSSPWAALTAGVLGLGMFALRRSYQGVYGAIEIVGACITLGICGFTDYGSTPQRLIALLGGMYFLVRGLDNADKGGLVPILKRLHAHLGYWSIVNIALILSVVVAVSLLPSRYDAIGPPYIEGRDGSRVPVSAIKCGDLFIICDESAWREHARLLRATRSERGRAETEAEARYNAFLASGRRHPTAGSSPLTPPPTPPPSPASTPPAPAPSPGLR